MNEKFRQLDAEYQKAKNEEDTQMQNTYLQTMRENLISLQAGDETYKKALNQRLT